MEEGPELQAQRRRRTLEEPLLGPDRLLRRRPPALPAAPRELGLRVWEGPEEKLIPDLAAGPAARIALAP